MYSQITTFKDEKFLLTDDSQNMPVGLAIRSVEIGGRSETPFSWENIKSVQSFINDIDFENSFKPFGYKIGIILVCPDDTNMTAYLYDSEKIKVAI